MYISQLLPGIPWLSKSVSLVCLNDGIMFSNGKRQVTAECDEYTTKMCLTQTTGTLPLAVVSWKLRRNMIQCDVLLTENIIVLINKIQGPMSVTCHSAVDTVVVIDTCLPSVQLHKLILTQTTTRTQLMVCQVLIEWWLFIVIVTNGSVVNTAIYSLNTNCFSNAYHTEILVIPENQIQTSKTRIWVVTTNLAHYKISAIVQVITW